MPRTVTRQELYSLVWSQPTLHLAKSCGLSDVGLAKLCRRHKIPRPPRGYWAKIQAGQNPCRVPLPAFKGDDTEIVLPAPDNGHVGEPDVNAEVREQVKAQTKGGAQIVVGDNLRGAHELVSATKQEFAGAKPNESRLLVPPETPSLNISVSKDQFRRSLLLMDALLKGLRDRDFQITTGPTIRIRDETVTFGIKEPLQMVREQPQEQDLSGYYEFGHSRFVSRYVPSGRLVLFIPEAVRYWANGCRKQWRDAKKQRLEQCLNRFVIGLIEVAAQKREHSIAEEKRRIAEAEAAKKREAEAQRIAELRKLQADEQEKLDLLLRQAEALRKSDDIRRLVAAVREATLASGKEIDSDSELAGWITWALLHADRFDPTKQAPPSILDEPIPEEPTRRW